MNAGTLNRRIQIRRFNRTGTDGFGGAEGEWQDLGAPLHASRRDISDAERMSAAQWDNILVSRFIVRSSAFTRDIKRTDEIVHEGITFEIDGIKEVHKRRSFLEITAKSGDVE